MEENSIDLSAIIMMNTETEYVYRLQCSVGTVQENAITTYLLSTNIDITTNTLYIKMRSGGKFQCLILPEALTCL